MAAKVIGSVTGSVTAAEARMTDSHHDWWDAGEQDNLPLNLIGVIHQRAGTMPGQKRQIPTTASNSS
jgi:hypothetical protein